MKKRFIPFLALAFLMPTFAGCSVGKVEYADPNVDMSVRQITAGENVPITEIIDLIFFSSEFIYCI